jgi:hypothetical protein
MDSSRPISGFAWGLAIAVLGAWGCEEADRAARPVDAKVADYSSTGGPEESRVVAGDMAMRGEDASPVTEPETVNTSRAAAPVRPQPADSGFGPAVEDASTGGPADSRPAAAAPALPPAQTAQAAPPAAQKPGEVQDITFDDIKLDMKKEDPWDRSLITPKIDALSGRTIRIRGYILPQSVFTQTGIDRFVLVRDNMECCFGPGALLHRRGRGRLPRRGDGKPLRAGRQPHGHLPDDGPCGGMTDQARAGSPGR